jgi:ankyrin repeat protein
MKLEFAGVAELNRELRLAADRGYVDRCRSLVEAGANVHAADWRGVTALHHAAQSARLDVCRYLIDAGAHLNALVDREESPMHWAVKQGHVEACRLLALMGADPSYRPLGVSDALYITSFQTAVRFNQVEVAVMFVDEFDVDPRLASWMPPEAEDEEWMRVALLAAQTSREVRLASVIASPETSSAPRPRRAEPSPI